MSPFRDDAASRCKMAEKVDQGADKGLVRVEVLVERDQGGADGGRNQGGNDGRTCQVVVTQRTARMKAHRRVDRGRSHDG